MTSDSRDTHVSEGTKVPIDLGHHIQVIVTELGVMLGISDRDDLLRHSVEFVRHVLGAERCAIFLYDEHSQALKGTYGTDDKGNTTDEHAHIIHLSGDRLTNLLELRKRGKTHWVKYEHAYYYFDRQVHQVEGDGWVAGTAITSASGRLIGVMYNDTAISHSPVNERLQQQLAVFCFLLGNLIERRQLESNMLHVQKLESLGILAGGIAHDFNNILTAVLGNADLALLDIPKHTPGRERISEIVAAARQAADLCKQMLAYSGRGQFIVKPLNISTLVREMAHMLEVSISKNAVLRLNLDPNIPAIMADAVNIRQVVMNLIINASDSVAANGGVISLATGCIDYIPHDMGGMLPEPELRPGRYVFLEVKDNGEGMDRETRSRIFEPFFTTKFTGRGLGLAAVQGIVNGHKGAIQVVSEKGHGAKFKILFPATSDTVGPDQADPVSSPAIRRHVSILVVDDDLSVRRIAESMLARYGYNVVSVECGAKALEMMERYPGAYAAVLLDMTMPQMNGDETYKRIRKLDADIPVILTSGYDQHDITSQFGEQKLNGFLQKPFLSNELITIIDRAVGQSISSAPPSSTTGTTKKE